MTSSSSQKGVTLIELLVSISIFTILLIMVSGIFSRFVITERRDISERALQEDIRFSLELFVREARTAYGSTYAVFPSSAGDRIVFRNQNGTCVAYRLFEHALQRAEALIPDGGLCDDVDYQNFLSLTSERTVVDNLHFKLPLGVTSPGQLNRQGFITLIMQARSTVTSIPPLDVQTTVTSRQVQFVE